MSSADHLKKRAIGVLVRVRRIATTLWLGVGVLLGAIAVVEAMYRAEGAVRRAIGARLAPAPATTTPGNAVLSRDVRAEIRATSTAWRPFVYYRRRPFLGRHVTVDSLGRRRTVQAHAPGVPTRDVFVFGGSPMWGSGLPDSATIPSRLAAELRTRGVSDAAITNFGETGYVFTQEAIELLLQLRAGARPAVVVFYDGFNDIDAALTNGYAGATKTERERARDFETGRAVFWWRVDLGTEARAFLKMAEIAAGRLQIVRRFQPDAALPGEALRDSLADDIVRTYLATVELVEALARHYGFVPLYAWMPIFDPVEKWLSPWERTIGDEVERSAAGREFLELRRLTCRQVTPAMEASVPGRFVNFSPLFAHDSLTVYVDALSHTTEAAGRMVAATLADYVTPLLRRAGRDAARDEGGR
jgi:hypothetical protein